MYKKIFRFSFYFFSVALVVELIIGYLTPINLRPRQATIFDTLFFAIPFVSMILFGFLSFLDKLKTKNPPVKAG